jgi:GT2 family glycosyltransferase
VRITVITSLYNCSKYLDGYFQATDHIENKEQSEFLLLHNAPKTEEINMINKYINERPWFRHIIIPEREGLYASWNRGVKIAQGKYCAIWNVDDIRFASSLELQAKILDNDESCGLVTGYLNCTDEYGKIGNKFYTHDIMDKYPNEVFCSCLTGCFPMWRKTLHKSIGYFDEQFKCVSDFDFQVRVAMHYKIGHVNESLGIYLENDPNKISNNGDQQFENNIIYLRYGVYNKLILNKVPASLKLYKINNIVNFGENIKLNNNKPFNLQYRIIGLFISIIKLLYYFAKDIFHLLKHNR